jgi:hypothetical protein
MALFGRRRLQTDYELVPSKYEDGRGFVVTQVEDGLKLSWQTLPCSDGLESLPVVGTSHRMKAFRSQDFALGRTVSLVPEPQNPYDPSAIGVWNDKRSLQVGYIPKKDAARLGRKIEKGERFRSIVIWEMMQGRQRVGIRILMIREGASISGPIL